MELIVSLLIGALTTAGIYLLLRRSVVKLVLGILFLNNAFNLLIFQATGLSRSTPPFIDHKGQAIASMADPLPQALILTAIVISFGIIAFTMILKYKYFQATGTEDLDQVKETEQ